MNSLKQVSSRTQVLCKKYFYEYWNQGGREHTFMNARDDDVGDDLVYLSS